MPKTTQLRTYTVRDGLLDEWIERWRSDIVPLRLKLGFEIGGAWVNRERNQFVWLISYEGPETFVERNALYWASPERKAMGLDPDDYLLHTDDARVRHLTLALPPQHAARLFQAQGASATEDLLRQVAAEALGEAYFRDNGRRAHGLEVELTDLEHL